MTDLPKMPDVRFTKNGYEIRTEILELAQAFVLNEYSAKFHGWEITASKNYDGQLETDFKMPEHPTIETILATAERLYSFKLILKIFIHFN